jgi:hypothetical protein
MGFIPRSINCYLVLGFYSNQRFNLFTKTSSPRKFAECFYCDVSPTPILPVVSCLIKFTCHIQFIQSYKLQLIHSYIHTLILSHIHTFMHYYIHSYTSYTQHHSYITALITHNLVWLYPFSSIFTHCCVKRIACKDLLLPLCQANSLQRSFATSVSSE